MKSFRKHNSYCFFIQSWVFSTRSGFSPLIYFKSSDELKAIDALEYMFMFITELDDDVQLCRFTMKNRDSVLIWSGFYTRGMDRIEAIHHPI